MKYRLIPFTHFSAAMNMALDEVIMEGLRTGTSPATIRFTSNGSMPTPK
jgi:hypothetical protein